MFNSESSLASKFFSSNTNMGLKVNSDEQQYVLCALVGHLKIPSVVSLSCNIIV